MYNTHPKLCYKILGKKVRIILEILRYVVLAGNPLALCWIPIHVNIPGNDVPLRNCSLTHW